MCTLWAVFSSRNVTIYEKFWCQLVTVFLPKSLSWERQKVKQCGCTFADIIITSIYRSIDSIMIKNEMKRNYFTHHTMIAITIVARNLIVIFCIHTCKEKKMQKHLIFLYFNVCRRNVSIAFGYVYDWSRLTNIDKHAIVCMSQDEKKTFRNFQIFI